MMASETLLVPGTAEQKLSTKGVQPDEFGGAVNEDGQLWFLPPPHPVPER